MRYTGPNAHISEQDDTQAWRFVSPDGEVGEQIHQVTLELYQWEMEALGQDVLQALAPLCFNDLRAIFLVHDERMLGIVLREIDSLVYQHNVLTVEEAETLNNGIVPTILPGWGSEDLHCLLERTRSMPSEKNKCLLKPVGSGNGKGIIFDSDITTDL